jgi:hypothetical protein
MNVLSIQTHLLIRSKSLNVFGEFVENILAHMENMPNKNLVVFLSYAEKHKIEPISAYFRSKL